MSEITTNGHNSLVDNRKFPNKSLVIPLKASKRRIKLISGKKKR